MTGVAWARGASSLVAIFVVLAASQMSSQQTATSSGISACAPDSAGAVARRVNRYLEPLVRAGELSGSILIAQGNCVLVERVFGMADLGRHAPNTPETRFAIASITKPLTDLVLAGLVRDGRLTLSDPLSRWLPTFPHAQQITIAELQQHRAGIPHRVTEPSDEYRPHTPADLVSLAAEHSLLFTPGTQTAYSTAGYSILARVLELASGRSYAALLDSLVFRPAGATGAVDATAGVPTSLVARSYLRVPNGLLPTRPRNLSYLAGGGSVYATPRDLFRIVRTLVDGGYGIVARDSALRRGQLDWTGITDGYIASVGYDQGTDMTIVVAANVYTGAIVLLHHDLGSVIAGTPVSPPRVSVIRPVRLSTAQQQRLAGPYETGPGQATALEFLTPFLAVLGGAHLVATSDTTFASPEAYDAVITVERDTSGEITALRWDAAANHIRYPHLRTTPKQ